MSTTTKKTKKTKKTTLNGVKTNPKEEIYYDPETGKRISKTGYFMKKIKAEGGLVKIMDMRAVLK